ncbi:MAG: DUF5682 family protein [Pseudomonadota bacterium]
MEWTAEAVLVLAPDDASAKAARGLVSPVLLAELPDAVQPVTQALENRAATTGDAAQLLAALPPLANVFRYGSVRQTDASRAEEHDHGVDLGPVRRRGADAAAV